MAEFDPPIRIDAPVARWCERCTVDGAPAQLSDNAAILIASARLDAGTRGVIIRRIDSDRDFPDVGGYARLRRLAAEIEAIARLREHLPDTKASLPALAVTRLRGKDLRRKLDALRYAFTRNQRVFASGFRSVRKDRKDALHIDLESRDRLFEALCLTPVPYVFSTTVFDRLTRATLGTATRWAPDQVIRALPERLRRATDNVETMFADRHETLLFVAGALYDRIIASSAWSTDYFGTHRMSISMTNELAQTATDIIALWSIRQQLESTPAASDDHSRVADLDAVWDELVERVVSLSRVVDQLNDADQALAAAARVRRAESLDRQIEALVARGGEREIAIENAKRIAAQLELSDVAAPLPLPSLPPALGDDADHGADAGQDEPSGARVTQARDHDDK